jgi:hypothetical protein
LLYNSDKDKDELVNALFSAISNTHNLNTPSSIISDYYNAKIDTLLLTIISDFGKLSFGYNNYSLTRDIITEILNIDRIKLIKTLTNCHLIGFQLFKNYDIVIRDLAEILEKILVLKQYDDSYYIPYSLLIGYLGYQISKRDSDLSMTFDEKDEILDISKDLLKANISNKEFISEIYNDLRTGKDFDIMLSPRKIRKTLEEKNNDNIKKKFITSYLIKKKICNKKAGIKPAFFN